MNDVRTIKEDRERNIWFGTSGGGLSRYDGMAFITFKEHGGLTRNYLQDIYVDRDGKLWFGFSGGAFWFDGKSLVNFTKW